jgi:HEPN domain-containing protein
LLHQSAERYVHTLTLVFTAYKHRTHNIERLAHIAESLDSGIRGALPRASHEEKELFKLLKRAYIDARYSPYYFITVEQLTRLREQVRDLATRVRHACEKELTSLCGPEEMRPLAEPPQGPEFGATAPAPPDLTDAAAVERWKDELLATAHETGRQQGLQEGMAKGRAGAIVDVLGWRGVVLSDEDRERILGVEEEATLERLWQRARFARTVAELFDDDGPTP